MSNFICNTRLELITLLSSNGRQEKLLPNTEMPRLVNLTRCMVDFTRCQLLLGYLMSNFIYNTQWGSISLTINLSSWQTHAAMPRVQVGWFLHLKLYFCYLMNFEWGTQGGSISLLILLVLWGQSSRDTSYICGRGFPWYQFKFTQFLFFFYIQFKSLKPYL